MLVEGTHDKVEWDKDEASDTLLLSAMYGGQKSVNQEVVRIVLYIHQERNVDLKAPRSV